MAELEFIQKQWQTAKGNITRINNNLNNVFIIRQTFSMQQ